MTKQELQITKLEVTPRLGSHITDFLKALYDKHLEHKAEVTGFFNDIQITIKRKEIK